MLTAMLIALSLAFAVPAIAQYSAAPTNDERELGEHGQEHKADSSYFWIKLGDNELSVRCPTSMPLQPCIAAAIELKKALEASSKP